MITLRVRDAELHGDLAIPDGATRAVLFANGGSGDGDGDRTVAEGLNAAGIGTLRVALLTEHEDELDRVTGALRFDLELLTLRLLDAVDRLTEGLESAPHTAGLPIGLFGGGAGAAAALVAAAARHRIGAVVCRGGRPDLAEPSLPRVRAPVLLIAAGRDTEPPVRGERVAELLDMAELHVISDAGPRFEEPGALEEVTMQAADWFNRKL